MIEEQQKMDEISLIDLKDFTDKCNLSCNVDNEYNFVYQFYALDSNNKLFAHSAQNKFMFNLQINNFRNNVKSVIIICSKDGSNILQYTLDKLKNFDILNAYDILLVDDRSASKEIFRLANIYNASYLRIDNNLNIFNYSIINNIAAAYAQKFDKELLIFYNNDMWPSSQESLDNLVTKHISYKSNITGCRLVYPTKQCYEEIGKPDHLLSERLEKIYNTIQHGGIIFCPQISTVLLDQNNNHRVVFKPSHLFRFYEKDCHLAKSDNRCCAVTGALQIINTEDFFRLGGFNVLLTASYQDIDICMRAIEKEMIVYYCGSEFMYHAESITNVKENITQTKEYVTDNAVWDILWANKLPYLLGINYSNKQYL